MIFHTGHSHYLLVCYVPLKRPFTVSVALAYIRPSVPRTQVAERVTVTMEKVCGTLEQEGSRLTQAMGETLFELYISLKTLKHFRQYLSLK